MKHRQAKEVLADYEAGRLDWMGEVGVANHLAQCEECRTWTETYQWLSEGIHGVNLAGEHPSSEELAQFALDSEFDDFEGRVATHLGVCRNCRFEVESTKAAVGAAQDSEEETRRLAPVHRAWGAILDAPQWYILAASVLVALVLAFFVRSDQDVDPNEDRVLTDLLLSGEMIVEANRSIVATRVEIESGSAIVFKAEDAVVLSDGFVVGGDASFRVEVSESPSQMPVPNKRKRVPVV